MFINSHWLRHVHMPSYMSSYGVSEEIEESIDQELKTLLDASRKKVRTIPHKHLDLSTQLVGTLTESILHVHSQENNVKFVKKLLGNLHCMRSKEDVGNALGEFLRFRIGTFLSIFTSPSELDSLTNYICFSTGNVGLQDTSYYTDSNRKKLYVLQAYGKLIQKLQDEFDIDHLTEFLRIEQDASIVLEKSRQDEEVKLSGHEIQRRYPHIPWESLAISAFQNEVKFETTEFLLLSTTWIEYLNTCFERYSIDTWRIWLSGNLLIYSLPLLPPPFDDFHYLLYGKKIRGQSEKTPQKQLALQMAQNWLTIPLGELYVEKFVSPDLKKQATEIAKEIQTSAAKRLGTLEWMESSTRMEGKKKIEALSMGVAYPDKKHEPFYKNVKIFPNTFVQNIFLLGESEFLYDIRQTGKPIDKKVWDDPVFAVNAYYYNEGNRLILPSGILHFPFFHTNASHGWNFGGLGAAIGHEITHAFDMDGREYDHKGNKRDWWTKKDTTEYEKRVKALEALFTNTTYFGQPLDGKLTLSENIADLGGIAIALGALKQVMEKNKIVGEERKKNLCDFFHSYAVSWRTKEKREKALQSLFMDVHAPPPARVNNIVCQFDDWYECYNVQPGDKLYKDPKERIRIF